MGAFTTAWNWAVWTNTIIYNLFFTIGDFFIMTFALFVPGVLLQRLVAPAASKGLAISIYFITLIVVLIYKFIVSIVFNWQTSVQ